MRRLLLIVLLGAVAAGSAWAAGVTRLTAQNGSTRATITYRWQGTFSKDVRAWIIHDGAKALDRRYPKIHDLPTKLRAPDLDGDDEPEVLADFFTGGAHCCWYSFVYHARGAHYGSTKHDWGGANYRFRDLNGDGIREFVSTDGRFAYEFSSYADSAFPVQIWNYDSGRLVDTTRSFRSAVRKDAARLWKAYRRNLHSSAPDPRGILAAWMADQYRLGRQKTGWAKLRAAERRGELRGSYSGDIWPKNGRYLAALRTFLKKLDYAN